MMSELENALQIECDHVVRTNPIRFVAEQWKLWQADTRIFSPLAIPDYVTLSVGIYTYSSV